MLWGRFFSALDSLRSILLLPHGSFPLFLVFFPPFLPCCGDVHQVVCFAMIHLGSFAITALIWAKSPYCFGCLEALLSWNRIEHFLGRKKSGLFVKCDQCDYESVHAWPLHLWYVDPLHIINKKPVVYRVTYVKDRGVCTDS